MIEPANFNNCSGIVLNGQNGASAHRLQVEQSTFNVQNYRGGPSYMSSAGFTVVIKNSSFIGNSGSRKNSNAKMN